MIATLLSCALIVCLANRYGHWLDSLPGDKGWEWDMTVVGIFVAALAYLIMDHL